MSLKLFYPQKEYSLEKVLWHKSTVLTTREKILVFTQPIVQFLQVQIKWVNIPICIKHVKLYVAQHKSSSLLLDQCEQTIETVCPTNQLPKWRGTFPACYCIWSRCGESVSTLFLFCLGQWETNFPKFITWPVIGLIRAVVYLYMYMEQSVFHPVAVKYIPSRLARYIGKTGSKEKCEGDYIFYWGLHNLCAYLHRLSIYGKVYLWVVGHGFFLTKFKKTDRKEKSLWTTKSVKL